MTTPVWAPGTLYQPGALVVPRTQLPSGLAEITNPEFTLGTTDWATSGTMMWSASNGFGSPGCIQAVGGNGGAYLAALTDIAPGQRVTARCMIATPNGSSGSGGDVNINWYTSGGVFHSQSQGNTVNRAGGTNYRPSTVSGFPPTGATKYTIGVDMHPAGGGVVRADSFSIEVEGGAPPGLVFRATQAVVGRSGDVEPTWPLTPGVPVVDNEVTWEGAIANRVVWQARPIMRTSGVEPLWPTTPGGMVRDGTINWRAASMRVTDPNCPNSELVIILASKVFAGDDDIVPYSATANPLDWTTPKDAGYLPTGLQILGSNPVAALGAYRGNLLVWNSEAFQMWQVDEDPSGMSLLDALPVGSTEHWASAPLVNDTIFLAAPGVRSIGIAASSTNLAAGDIGLPVDPLVQRSREIAREMGARPLGFYVPGAGQYWLTFNVGYDAGEGGSQYQYGPKTPEYPEGFPYMCVAHVYTITTIGAVGAWSRYLFPFQIDDQTMDGDVMVLRSGDTILDLLPDESMDMMEWQPGDGGPGSWALGQTYPGQVWWPWLDFGSPGFDKSLEGFDLVGEGSPFIQVGYAQQHDPENDAYFTDPHQLEPDNVTGDLVPYEVTGPSFSIRLTYNGGEQWRFLAMNLYLLRG